MELSLAEVHTGTVAVQVDTDVRNLPSLLLVGSGGLPLGAALAGACLADTALTPRSSSSSSSMLKLAKKSSSSAVEERARDQSTLADDRDQMTSHCAHASRPEK